MLTDIERRVAREMGLNEAEMEAARRQGSANVDMAGTAANDIPKPVAEDVATAVEKGLLTAQEGAVCRRMGLTVPEFLAARKNAGGRPGGESATGALMRQVGSPRSRSYMERALGKKA